MPIDLTVRAIHAYGKDFDFWDSGMSALVEVDGDASGIGTHTVIVADEAR